MCACGGTGVIQNDIGMGMYQIAGCICKAGQRSHEELDQRRQVLMMNLKIALQLQKDGKWDDEAHRKFAERRLHDSSAITEVHEEVAS